MRRASLAVLSILAVTLLMACGGSGDRTSSFGDATVTVPDDVEGVKGELTAILEQFPYQHWYTSCVEKRFRSALSPSEEEALAKQSDPEREASVNRLIGKVGPACEATSNRLLIDPNATSEELDLLRAELVPLVDHLAESEHLDPSQTACATNAFEKLPDRYIVEFGNGDDKSRGAILLTVFKACAESN